MNTSRSSTTKNIPSTTAIAGWFGIAALTVSITHAAAPEGVPQDSSKNTALNAQSNSKPKNTEEFARGRILVVPRAGLPARAFANILAEHNGKARKIGQSNIYIVDLPEHTEEGVIARLAHHPHLKFAELDRIIPPAYIPNDPIYGDQWHLPKMGAPIAWDTTQGAGVTIAILDSGVNSQHPDLVGQLVPGWNFYDNNSDTTDLTGHGTYVTGTVTASTNNGIGNAAVAGQAKVMPVRVTSPTSGSASYSRLAEGLIYAADHGARVANASFSNVMGSTATLDAAQYMKSKNGLVTVSAGNTYSQESYTATPTMIQVSATDEFDLKPTFSSYGDFVDLAAPGINIWTTNKEGGYSKVRGTSFSSPITAGVIALMMAANPKLSNLDIENLLYSTAVDLGDPGKDIYYGHGRVNAAAAVQAALLAYPSLDTVAPTVSIINPLGGAAVAGLVPVDIEAADNVGVVRAELLVNNTVVAVDTSMPFAFTWDSTSVPNGVVNLVARVFDAAGNQSSSTVEINVNNQVIQPPPIADTTPPVVQIINPVAGNVTGSVTININAEDNAGASGISMTIYIDGSPVATGTGSTLVFIWNTQPKRVTKGMHTIKATAKDAAGNTTSTSVSVNVIK